MRSIILTIFFFLLPPGFEHQLTLIMITTTRSTRGSRHGLTILFFMIVTKFVVNLPGNINDKLSDMILD